VKNIVANGSFRMHMFCECNDVSHVTDMMALFILHFPFIVVKLNVSSVVVVVVPSVL